MQSQPRYATHNECLEIIRFLFSDYIIFFQYLVPDSWVQTEYVRFFHPTPEHKLEETQRMRENINHLRQARDPDWQDNEPPYSLADFPEDDLSNINEQEEFLKLLGLTVYDIFSNNHDVLSPEGKIYSLGSMRGSGRFLAEFFNVSLPDITQYFDYLDFYMGMTMIEDRADLTPFYLYIFSKLKQKNCDWKYYFPRMHLISFKKDQANTTSPEFYNPELAQQQAIEQKKQDRQNEELQKRLDDIYEEELDTAKYNEPPKIVQAYREVYGHLPRGFPEID